jgi:hypothetical protein
MSQNKLSTVTFKAEPSLLEMLKRIPNRSSFIRAAILAAMENTCPLCQGAGFLSPEQKNHWNNFARDHRLQECGKCNEWYLVCSHQDSGEPHEG